MNVTRSIDYGEYKKNKKFRIEPSRRKCVKPIDPEQRRIFAERQKRLPQLWAAMGIRSYAVLENKDGVWVEIFSRSLR